VTLAPVAPDRRLALVDALRAVALLGILLVNVSYYAHPFEVRMIGQGPDQPAIDAAATAVMRFFAEGKFYTLFSLLFGFGLATQLSHAEERGRPDQFRGRWRRRLLVLLAFGVLHGALLWAGDVLTAYALLGFLALRLARTAPRRLVGWAIGLNLATVLVIAGLAALLWWAADQHGQSEIQADATRAYRTYASGTFAEITRERLADYGMNVASWVLLFPGLLLGNFAFGIWVARRGLLADPAAHRTLLRRMFVGGVLVGLPANAAHLALGRFLDRTPGMPESDMAAMTAGLATMAVGGAAFCLAYLSGLALLWQRAPRPRRWLQAIAPAGRMALTNYLLQSLICTTIFYGYGLGWFGKLGAAAALGLALVVWTAEVVLSRWWLARHAFGPVEWLWRSLTYGARQPMRLRGAPPPS
jgi:uncharacterized protein